MSSIIKAGVIGYPITHSISPDIHNYWLKEYNIAGEYSRYEVKPDELENFLLSMQENGLFGVNITVPHKEDAYHILKNHELLIKCDDVKCKVAKILGATNTVTALPNGRFQAANTDFIGFGKSVYNGAPDFNFRNSSALVIGAGGASKAIVFALIEILKVKSITITNRTIEKSEEIAAIAKKEFNYDVKVVDWNNRSDEVANHNFIINTTALGMKGKDRLEISLELLRPNSLVTDIVYNPLETEIITQAKAKNAVTVDGLGMLMYQAAPAFEGWFGKTPIVTPELKEILVKKLGL